MSSVGRRLLILVGLGACGCDVSYSEPRANPSAELSILAPSASVPTETCPAGGTAIHWGVDTNGDGGLALSEVRDTFIVCPLNEGADPAEVAALWEAIREVQMRKLEQEADPFFAASLAATLTADELARWRTLPVTNPLASAAGMVPGGDCAEGTLPVVRGGQWACERERNGDLDCSGCVSVEHLDFAVATQADLQNVADALPTSVEGMSGGGITSSVSVNGVLSATAIEQGGHDVCDASGNCDLRSVTAGRLDTFGTAVFSRNAVSVSELETVVELDIPSLGAVSDLQVSIHLTQLDVSLLTVELEDPDGASFVLYDSGSAGSELIGTYPSPDAPVSGDLSTWSGRDPQGTWVLRVTTGDTGVNGRPSELVQWSMTFGEASGFGQNVRVPGHLEVQGELRGALSPDFDSGWTAVDSAVDSSLAWNHDLGATPSRVTIHWAESLSLSSPVIDAPPTVTGQRSLLLDPTTIEIRFAVGSPIVGWLEAGIWEERASGFYRIRAWR